MHALKLREFIYLAVILLAGAAFFVFHEPKPTPIAEAKIITETCKDVGQNQISHEKCTAKEFADAGDKWGLKFIGDTLSVYQSINSGYQSYQSCHVLAHRIMNDLGAREKGAWVGLMDAMGRGELDPARCGGGFMHGSIEARASEDPDFKVNATLFNEVCGKPEAVQYSSSCAHILGHLALVGAYGELGEAVDSCTGLKDDFLFQCYGGIFMEDSMRTNLSDHGIKDLPVKNGQWFKTQLARCSQYGSGAEVVDGCWYDMPEVFAQTNYYDLEGIYRFCATAPTRSAEERCYTRGSYLVMIVPDHLFRSNYNEVLCSAYEPGSQALTHCMRDVVGAALTGSIEFLDRTVGFCSARPQSAQAECFSNITGFLKYFPVGQERSSLCAKLPQQYAETCLK